MDNINDLYLKNMKKKIKKLAKNPDHNYDQLITIYQDLLHQYYKIKFQKN